MHLSAPLTRALHCPLPVPPGSAARVPRARFHAGPATPADTVKSKRGMRTAMTPAVNATASTQPVRARSRVATGCGTTTRSTRQRRKRPPEPRTSSSSPAILFRNPVRIDAGCQGHQVALAERAAGRLAHPVAKQEIAVTLPLDIGPVVSASTGRQGRRFPERRTGCAEGTQARRGRDGRTGPRASRRARDRTVQSVGGSPASSSCNTFLRSRARSAGYVFCRSL